MSANRLLDQIRSVPQTIPNEFVGDLAGNDNYIVQGTVMGNCDIEGTVMLGPNSHWKGNVMADVVVVRGLVEGNITARTKVEVRDSGRVRGDISSPIVAMAQGAKHEGRINPESCIMRFVERRNR